MIHVPAHSLNTNDAIIINNEFIINGGSFSNVNIAPRDRPGCYRERHARSRYRAHAYRGASRRTLNSSFTRVTPVTRYHGRFPPAGLVNASSWWSCCLGARVVGTGCERMTSADPEARSNRDHVKYLCKLRCREAVHLASPISWRSVVQPHPAQFFSLLESRARRIVVHCAVFDPSIKATWYSSYCARLITGRSWVQVPPSLL